MANKKSLHFDLEETYQRIIESFGTANAAEIGRQVGKERQSVYKWRDGKSRPDIETLVEIARVTNSSLHWLLTGEGPKSRDDLKKTLPLESKADYTHTTAPENQDIPALKENGVEYTGGEQSTVLKLEGPGEYEIKIKIEIRDATTQRRS